MTRCSLSRMQKPVSGLFLLAIIYLQCLVCWRCGGSSYVRGRKWLQKSLLQMLSTRVKVGNQPKTHREEPDTATLSAL